MAYLIRLLTGNLLQPEEMSFVDAVPNMNQQKGRTPSKSCEACPRLGRDESVRHRFGRE